jgi:hypothetical protein
VLIENGHKFSSLQEIQTRLVVAKPEQEANGLRL